MKNKDKDCINQEELGLIGAKIDNLQNQSLRIIKQAGYLRRKVKPRPVTVDNVAANREAVEFLEDFVKNFAEPYENLYNQHTPDAWRYLFNEPLGRSNTECKKIIQLKSSMYKRWSERPDILKGKKRLKNAT